MRIAILADPLDNQHAGIHIYTKELIKALAEHDHQNEYILVREKKSDDFSQFRQVVISNIRLPIGFASLRLFYLIPRLLQKLNVDIVVEPAHFGPFNLPRRIKRITVIHDLTPIRFPHFHRWHSQVLQNIFLRRILDHTNLIISNSQQTTADIAEKYPHNTDKIVTIPLGKEVLFKPDINEQNLAPYNIRYPYFLYVGTIEPRKNLVGLLLAYQSFRKKFAAKINLVITGGKGWRSNDFFTALQNHPYRDDIQLTGYLPRNILPSLYSSATAFIYPSFYEGFGLPVLEAMACGAPCIISKVASLPEVGGNAALYFLPDDMPHLAELMEKVATNASLKTELSKRSIRQAENFSWEKYAYSFMAAVKKLGDE